MRVGRKKETVSKKKRSGFLLMDKCFFLTYFLIGASGGLARRMFGGPVRQPSGGPDLKFLVNSLGLPAISLAGLPR